MNKKVLSLVLAVMLVCSMAMVASAAPSAEADDAPATEVTSNEAEVSAEDITVTAVTNTSALSAESAKNLQETYQAITSAPSTAAFLETVNAKAAVETALASTGKSVSDMTVHSVFDIAATGAAKAELDSTGKVTVSFAVPELKANDVAVVMVLTPNGWQVVPSVVVDGKITTSLTALSTVVVMVQSAGAAPAANW